MYRVRSGAFTGITALIQQLGQNPLRLLQSAGLTEAQFRDPDTFLPYATLAELMELCARRCEAPLFGLLLAERQDAAILGDLRTATSASTTIREALETAAQYLYLHARGVRLELRPRGELTRLALAFDFGTTMGTDQIMLMSVGQLAHFVSDLLPADSYGLALHYRQAPPLPGELPPSRFRRPLFNREFDGVALRTEQLQRPRHHDPAQLRVHFQDYLLQLQQRYPDRLEDQIKDVIGRLLPAGECNLERVATTLAMHPRTLQSRLQARGGSYRRLLQQTRMEIASRHLAEGDCSITELALLLGYAEVAVFSRHFRRWTGHSPRAWRREQREESLSGSGHLKAQVSAP